jgi:predicted nucleotidyltransferase/DNA-binding XRE family transcriptional regulator
MTKSLQMAGGKFPLAARQWSPPRCPSDIAARYHDVVAMSDLAGAGALVRAERLRAGLTQRALAERSGVSQPVVAAVESGRRVPTRATSSRLLDAAAERPSVRLARHRELVRRILDDFGASDVRLFGSVARGRDVGGSDIDLLVHLPAGTGLFALNALVADLEDVLGVPVDIVSDRAPADALAEAARESVPL